MNDKRAGIRSLKQKWNEEDAARDRGEKRAQQLFLEGEANQTFAPIEDLLNTSEQVAERADLRAFPRRPAQHSTSSNRVESYGIIYDTEAFNRCFWSYDKCHP
jgi:hypothetical protein